MALNSPCAACKFLRRKCTQECPFAPYFPPDQPQKFSNVHKVFGASNVAKILQELNAAHREDAVTSLAFEAEARLRDPVYGCVGVISTLTTKLGHLQTELFNAKKELCNYIGPSGMGPPLLQHQPHPHQFLLQQHPTHQNLSPSIVPFAINNNPPMALGLAAPGASSSQYQLIIREQQQVQQRRDLLESQHLAAVVAREQELMRSYEQQQQQQLEQQQLEQQQELVGYNNVVGYDPGSGIVGLAGGFTNANAAGLVNPAVPVVQFDNNQFQLQQQQQQQLEERLLLHHHHQQQQHQQQPVLLLQQPQQQQRAGSEEGTSVIGPSA